MRTLRFGVVGCGAISTLYQLPALRRCPGVEPVAVVDVDGAWAARVARRFRVAESHTDHRALAGRVDAALVATPNATHADITCELLEAGIHVLCEKPMATTRADLDRMLVAAARTGSRLMAAHCLRFSPNVAMLARLVASGSLGTLTEISAGIGGAYEDGAQRTDFRRRRALSGGGVLVDLGVHVIDLAVSLVGAAPVDVRFAGRAAEGWEVETDADVGLTFPGSMRANLAASLSRGLENTLTVRGAAGWAVAPLYVPTQLELFSERARACRMDGLQRLLLPPTSMYEAQLAHFRAAVLSGEEFCVSADHVRTSVDVIERCYGMGEAA